MAKKDTLDVTQLDLDTDNPRMNAEDNQTDALRSLMSVEKDGEKVYELARDICEAGMLDPGDRLYVVNSSTPDRYVVLDGNRRLAALRLLSQPGIIEREDVGLSQSIRNRFKRLQTEFANRWPSQVDVVIFESRDQANRFIRLRHTGENSGAGRSAWSALQIARFDNTGLWQCLDMLAKAQELSLAVANELSLSAFNITSFERVVSTDEFQRRFGCRIGKSTFTLGENAQRAMKALARVANDVAIGRVTSRGDFAEAKNMGPYIDEVETAVGVQLSPKPPQASPVQPTTGGTNVTQLSPKPPQSSPDLPVTGTRLPPAPPATITPAHSPDVISVLPIIRKKRVSKFLLAKSDLANVTSPKCREIVIELKQHVPVQAAPFACALLLRCLLELTAEIYVRDVIGGKPTDRSANMTSAAKHLLGHSHATDTADKQDIAKNFDQFRDAYEQLSTAAHSKLTNVSTEHVRSTWTNLGGGMDLLWKRIHAAEIARASKQTSN